MKRLLSLLLLAAFGFAASAQSNEGTLNTAAGIEEEVFVVVEHDPEFPGGMEKLYQYLSSNIQYPVEAKAKKVTGTVYITFVIEKDGSISNIKPLRCPDESLCAEAMRVVKNMPKWKPGRQRGKPVRVQYNLPIKFSLN